MTRARLARLLSYPLKGCAPVTLCESVLEIGAGLPWDRRFALVNGEQEVAADGAWTPCQAFRRLTRNADLATWRVHLSGWPGGTPMLHVKHPQGQAWAWPLEGKDDALPSAIGLGDAQAGTPLAVARAGYWDHADAAVSLINLASVRALSAVAGVALDPVRLRGNLHVDGLPPWQELAWPGRRLCIGQAELEVLRPIDRCSAPSVNPESGKSDVNLLAALLRAGGHGYCGVYARVLKPGLVREGDAITDLGPAPQALHAATTVSTAPAAQDWPRMARVESVQEEGGILHLLLRDPLAGLAGAARPGQHLRVHRSDRMDWRCYTLSDHGREDGLLRLSVRLRAQGFSRWLRGAAACGGHLLISGPQGGFHLHEDHRKRLPVLISAGIGITPMLAMAAALRQRGSAFRALHVARGDGGRLWAELSEHARLTSQAQALLHSLDQFGRPIWTLYLPTLLRVAADAVFYLCGPGQFTDELEQALLALGVRHDHIRRELFVSPNRSPQVKPAYAGPCDVHFTRSGRRLIWRAEDGSLLDLAERHGLAPPWQCRAGHCQQCSSALVAGRAQHPPWATPRQSGRVLLCCATPLGALEVEA